MKVRGKGGTDPNFYASHPGMWKRRQEKGGTDPNIFDFIISDYSIIVKWLTDILLFQIIVL